MSRRIPNKAYNWPHYPAEVHIDFDKATRILAQRRAELDRRKARGAPPKGPAQTPRRVRARSVARYSRHADGRCVSAEMRRTWRRMGVLK